MKPLAPGTRIRTKLGLSNGWQGKGTITGWDAGGYYFAPDGVEGRPIYWVSQYSAVRLRKKLGTLAPGTRVRLRDGTKGTVVSIEPLRVLVKHGGVETWRDRNLIVVLRKKPNPDLLAARAEIERLSELLAAANMELAGRFGAGQIELNAAKAEIFRLRVKLDDWPVSLEHTAEAQPTLRDQFAMAALTGLIAGHHKVNAPREAFGIADLMMAERAKAIKMFIEERGSKE